jgi:AcrR family transcriptional regulator
MTTPNAPRTARERARAELTREIKEAARRQFAAVGADGLSLRAVSRELGMASSALYRYYPSRDDLLTALIIDAYDAIGAAAEAAIAGAGPGSGRAGWMAACHAIRAWAVANPHEYALIYGSPVPGYRAPQATIASAIRVVRVLGGLLADARPEGRDGGRPAPPPAPAPAHPAPGHLPPAHLPPARGPLPRDLAEQAAIVADAIAPGVPGTVITRGLIAWTQLFGMISFELFGQLVGSADPADEFFGFAVEAMADFIPVR